MPATPIKPSDHLNLEDVDTHAAASREWDTVRAASKLYAEAMTNLAEAVTKLAPATGDKLADLVTEVRRKEDWLRRSVVEYAKKRFDVVNGAPMDGDDD